MRSRSAVAVTNGSSACALLLGRATSRADVNAPVGCDTHGYAYRSGGGEKVHNAVREAYGAAFGEGDVVGVYLSLGATSQRKARGVRACNLSRRKKLTRQVRQEVVRPAGQPPSQLFTVERERRRAGSSAVAFAVNGVAQSVAYTTVVGGAAPLRAPFACASANAIVQKFCSLLPACSRSHRKRSLLRYASTSGLISSSRRLNSASASQRHRLSLSWCSQRRSDTRFLAGTPSSRQLQLCCARSTNRGPSKRNNATR